MKLELLLIKRQIMKNISHILVCSLFVFSGLSACKSQEKSTATTQNVEKKVATKGGETISTDPQPDKKPAPCRLLMTFISIGEGPDFQAKDKLDNFISQWEIDTQRGVDYEIRGWGREGEADYCFMLNELGADEQQRFINGATAAVEGSELVKISENKASYYEE